MPPDPEWGKTGNCISDGEGGMTCCWSEPDLNDPEGEPIFWCQTCILGNPPICDTPFIRPGHFTPPQGGVLEETPTPPTGPISPPQGGGVLQQPPSEGEGIQPLTRDQGVLPQGGLLQQQQQPTDQGAAEPTTAEEEEQPVPVCQESLEFNEDLGFCVPTECPEGQVLDEDIGICVLEEQEAEQQPEEQPQQEQPEEQPQVEEEQEPAEENGSDEETGNNG